MTTVTVVPFVMGASVTPGRVDDHPQRPHTTRTLSVQARTVR
jgi:hypothetical protein